MKRFRLIIFFLCSTSLFANPQIKERLSLLYSPKVLKQIVQPVDEWHPFPTYEERDEWEQFSQQIRNDLIRKGEAATKREWPHLAASRYLDFIRNGNRSKYQMIESARRYIILDLAMAELAEGKGRFMDDLVNAVWSICEQSTWTLPAHERDGLPDVNRPTVALLSAESGAMLAWIHYLFQTPFDKVSPRINERILYEIDQRILTPCHERDDFWWMGFNDGMINNWNPWCNSNWLTCILLAEQDSVQKYQDIHKCLRSIDRYIDTRPEDGGCDEGPGYWNHAGGTLFIALELLDSVTKRRLNIFNDPLIRNIGHYIVKAHINGPWFVNFADASAKIKVDGTLIFNYGQAVKDNDMMALGKLALEEGFSYTYPSGYNLYRRLNALFTQEIIDNTNTIPLTSVDAYLPDTEVMTARSTPQKDEGLFLAAKGGHNAESHNHNDVGNFIIYKNGDPFIIDIGVETYTRKTFSKDRYTIWTMKSDYHNLPTINGLVQRDGTDFKAKDVTFEANQNQVAFSLDIAKAYPDEAGVASWKRKFIFKRSEFIKLIDVYKLERLDAPVRLHLISLNEPELVSPGKYQLYSKQHTSLEILFSSDVFETKIEKIDVTDSQLQSVWGSHLYRIHLISKFKQRNDSYEIQFK